MSDLKVSSTKKKIFLQHSVVRIKQKDGSVTKQIYNEGFRRATYWDKDGESLRRVLKGLKPFGTVSHGEKKTLDQMARKLKKKGFAMRRLKTKNGECLEVCRKGKLSDLFDMEALARDYEIHVSPRVAKEIRKSSNLRLESFLGNKWDGKLWLTGLILGYPVENTMSLCYIGHVI